MEAILLIEDDTEISTMIQTLLQPHYQVTAAYSGTEGLLLFEKNHYQLVLLDIMLPGKNGDQVLQTIRQSSQVPVIMLTALSDKKNISQYLLAGADDYLVKPFDIEELQARIIVQLRKTSTNQSTDEQIRYKNLTIFPNLFEISNGHQQIQLKKKEFDLLKLLIDHPQQIFTKETLYEKIWQQAYYGDENTVNVHISNLRKKIQQLDADTAYIETVWGIGIKLA